MGTWCFASNCEKQGGKGRRKAQSERRNALKIFLNSKYTSAKLEVPPLQVKSFRQTVEKQGGF